jgi:4-hydroxy-tetrahydrodipicolinate synthase
MSEKLEPRTYRGIFTPLVTPVNEDESLDTESLRRLVDFQLENGIHGFWVMGTTGEFAAFDENERFAATEAVVDQTQGRVPVIVNVSDAATRLVLRHAKRAREGGADAVAVTPPYYYPHSQGELLAHYRAVAASADLPVFIYNIPQTVRVKVGLQTAITLASEGTVAGIKDSQNDLEWFRQLVLGLKSKGVEGFTAFVGTRQLIDAAVLAGAAGAIPSIANSHPDLCVKAYESAAGGDFAASARFENQVVEIESRISANVGSNNGAVIGAIKEALRRRGVLSSAKLTGPLIED